ncbi:SAGA-associated factor 29-like isoform X2 [Homarus americanus]|uniref:SAGA-associated factor 29-like isoform X2 n=1 Tax=Homarus americanus TaxID=6706 RepID=UPI001C45C5D3|nr:SAGA-associated factor 29-like isoform X2 [Homarus americanus]
MGKGKDKTIGSPKRGIDSPKSPKMRGGGGGSESSPSYRRDQLIRSEPLPPINVTPYPLSTSTEMAMAMSSEAQALQERVKVLSELVRELQEARDDNAPHMNAINALSDKIVTDEKLTSSNRTKLKLMYEKGVTETEKEVALVKKALNTVYQIRNIRHDLRIQAKNSGNKETIRRGALMKMLLNCAQTLPLWIGNSGEKPPALCGAVPPEQNYVAKVNDMVACLVRGSEGEDNWILAEVVSYNTTTNKYEVDDIDEEQKERHTLSRRRVYPLPLMRANPEVNPEALYPKGSIVMALYPQTTCFYKAVINRLPTLATEEYEVLFEDPTYADGYSPPLMVAQRYVIQIKEVSKKK